MAKQMTDSNSSPTHEQIARRAYEIFIERGQPENQDLAHWLEAERQLRASSQTKSASAQISSTPSNPTPTTSPPIRATTPAASNGRSNGRSKAPAALRK